MMIDLTGNEPKVVEYVETGRTYLDGSVQVGALDGVVRDRIRMALNGHVTVTLILDEDDEALGDPWCEIMGLPETGRSTPPLVGRARGGSAASSSARAGKKTLADDDKLEEELRRVVRQRRAERDRQEARGDGGGQPPDLIAGRRARRG